MYGLIWHEFWYEHFNEYLLIKLLLVASVGKTNWNIFVFIVHYFQVMTLLSLWAKNVIHAPM